MGIYGGDIANFIEAGGSGKIDVSGSLEGRVFLLSQLQEAYYKAVGDLDRFRVAINCQFFNVK